MPVPTVQLMRKLPWFDPEATGRRLQQVRGPRSQREIGDALGYRQPQVSRYESGDVPASFRYLAGLAALFDVDLNWLLTGRRAKAGGRSRRPPEASPDTALAEVRQVVRSAVREAIAEARVPMSSRRVVEPPAVGLAASTGTGHGVGDARLPRELVSPGDRLVIGLPIVLGPLLQRPGSGGLEELASTGGVSTRSPGEDEPGAGDVDRLLADVALLARTGDAAAAAERLTAAADVAESAASRQDYEASRLLRTWAWLLLAGSDSAAARLRSPILLFEIARATRLAGRAREAVGLYRAALERARALGDRETVARCHTGLGHVCFETGAFEEARAEYVAALELALERGRPGLLLAAHLNLAAYRHEYERDYAGALEHARAGLGLARAEGDAEHEGRFRNEIGLNEMELGDLEAARRSFRQVLEIAERRESAMLRVIGENNLADLAIREGALSEAASLLATSRAAAREAGWVWAELQAEILLARAEHAAGRDGAALERLERVRERAALQGLRHEDGRARELEREIRRELVGRLEAVGGA